MVDSNIRECGGFKRKGDGYWRDAIHEFEWSSSSVSMSAVIVSEFECR